MIGGLLFLFFGLLTAVTTGHGLSCKNEKSLQERTRNADIVIAGYTRGVSRSDQPSGNYTAEFLVFNIFKGEQKLTDIYRNRKPSALEIALSKRLVNVSGFGVENSCNADVSPGETYVLFLHVLKDGQLSTMYDGRSGTTSVYTREKEDEILEAMGSRTWNDWSTCSGSCGGGVQQRRRACDTQEHEQRCSNEEGQQRVCNMFPCTDVFDLLDAVGLRKSLMHPADRPLAYRLVPRASWRPPNGTYLALPRLFPVEFSLLLAVRMKAIFSTPGFLLRIFQHGTLQFGVYLGEQAKIFLSSSEIIQVTFKTSVTNGKWHYLGISFQKGILSLYADCKEKERLPVFAKIKPIDGQTATIVVGSLGNRDTINFQGDVEQLQILEDPNAASKQCSTVTQPLVSRTRGIPLRAEVHGRPLSDVWTANRGDITVDDEEEDEEEEEEDFDFGDDGSGLDDTEKETSRKKTELRGIPIIPIRGEDSVTTEWSTTITKKPDSYEDDSHEQEDDSYDDENDADENAEDENEIEGSGSLNYKLAWSEWSPCSATCNWGRRSRTSFCIDNAAKFDVCMRASAMKSETEACFLRLCPTTTSTVAVSSTVDVSTTTVTTPTVTNTSITSTFTVDLAKKPLCYKRCQNGGICKSTGRCACRFGYYGETCQHALCKPSCRNGGKCIAPNKCHCKKGYASKACEKAICIQGCKNGGHCIAPNMCACQSGYAGKDCGSPICHPYCQNGGYCVKPYSCHCPPFTKGLFCEKFFCHLKCQNGGMCGKHGKCSCPQGYTGRLCEKALCIGSCKNGGTCSKEGKCVCPYGFTGFHCEIRKCNFMPVQEPYKRSYKQKVVSKEKIPCGAWGWKSCLKTKVHYVTLYKTFYRTVYRCNSVTDFPKKKFPDVHHLKKFNRKFINKNY